MNIAVITGSGGLLGGECVKLFSGMFDIVIGIDNNMRSYFFGHSASTDPRSALLESEYPNLKVYKSDISHLAEMQSIFSEYGSDIKLIVHTAAQPSHDWAAGNPMKDFEVNALGTLNLLENFRLYCPKACFIFSSTNKVYGTHPNNLTLVEYDTRFDLPSEHPLHEGIGETMSTDHTLHSLFGASKLSADTYVQEYRNYFNLNTVVFRAGCITGESHAAVAAHGFLNYLIKCLITNEPYYVIGYRGKQVRDNIHAEDLAFAFLKYYLQPSKHSVYNIGGGRENSVSVLEAISMAEKEAGKKLDYSILDLARTGDHKWYITDNRLFKSDYPDWKLKHSLTSIIEQTCRFYQRQLLQEKIVS